MESHDSQPSQRRRAPDDDGDDGDDDDDDDDDDNDDDDDAIKYSSTEVVHVVFLILQHNQAVFKKASDKINKLLK